MKTIRLFYPDHASGGLEEYYFGAELMRHILPENSRQLLIRVQVAPPDGQEKPVTNGIYAEREVLFGIRDAWEKLEAEQPDRVITIGGNCIVSLAPFDYLHGRYKNLGILWIDAHPDVSTPEDGYAHAHAMVLGSLLGGGAPQLAAQVRHGSFQPEDVLYVGLQGLHDYQQKFLDAAGVPYKVQMDAFLPLAEIERFAARFDRLLIHLDIDVLDAARFHSTYFANPELVGDGSGGGRMTLEQLSCLLCAVAKRANVAGFTIAEYLPFDACKLRGMFSQIPFLTE